MKKHTIWIIIGLMAISLVGIILIQSRWIIWSINLNEEKFSKEVASALNHVERRLSESENALDILSPDIPGLLKRIPGSSPKLDELSSLRAANRSKFQQNLTLLEGIEVTKLLQSQDLTDRIGDISKLRNYLKHELERRDIDIGYHYGVYANKSNSFVILDDNYVVVEEGNQFSNTPLLDKSLLSSTYKIELFYTGEEGSSPGSLFIDFPGRNRILLKNVWPTILGSVFFTAIILFCFYYTIMIIFRQKKLSEMRTDFINNMTHEFKTPIATINLAADSINSPMIINQPGKINRFTGIIKQENHRMLNQVEKVLQMALLDKKDFKLNLSDVNLHNIIIQAVEHANLQVEKKGGKVLAELGASKPIVKADKTHLSNIIYNLLDNANKYSPDAPRIKVRTQNSNGGIEITVEDKGIGMTKDQRKHIFDKFYRIPTGNLHDVKGFGLGLSYVKAMVSAHKGKIEVQSEPGGGSRFILQLPQVAEQEKTIIGVS
jgi:two-component system phosphate regulon sensor histidine kinase PhoR